MILSSELGIWDSPNPSLASECAPPPRTGEGGEHALTCGWADEGLGKSQFRRLEKKLSTLLICHCVLLHTVCLQAAHNVHNGGFCNGSITKRCLHNSTNVSYNVLFHDCPIIKDESEKNVMFLSLSLRVKYRVSYEWMAEKYQFHFVMHYHYIIYRYGAALLYLFSTFSEWREPKSEQFITILFLDMWPIRVRQQSSAHKQDSKHWKQWKVCKQFTKITKWKFYLK
jgi:hypothetical protein